VHRDEDAKDDSDESREQRGLEKDADAGSREESLRQRTLNGEISHRA
jgi:hypothetical protein